MLGLLREGEGVAARVLENLGADPSNIRTQVIIATFFFSSVSVFECKVMIYYFTGPLGD